MLIRKSDGDEAGTRVGYVFDDFVQDTAVIVDGGKRFIGALIVRSQSTWDFQAFSVRECRPSGQPVIVGGRAVQSSQELLTTVSFGRGSRFRLRIWLAGESAASPVLGVGPDRVTVCSFQLVDAATVIASRLR